MSRFLIAAAAMASAAPAAAQSADGDWWWVDTSAGKQEEIVLVDGEPRRSGDLSELSAYIAYRSPDGDNVIGVDTIVTVDCARNTVTVQLARLHYADGTSEAMADRGKPQPLATAAPSYQFACTSDRSASRRYGKRPRLGIVAEIYAANPKQ